ncbi:hypothetical protein BDZ89DRAFT_1074573 [Hymenopellis radicata]|nr:hypothetical protein BDZ89DRAFT_1074573 [Hymenopellis radicata]
MTCLRLSPFPDIPIDIARLIFETAVWDDGTTAYSLVLVSKVVREWIDPILYNSVTLYTKSQLVAFRASIISRNDSAFFSRAVKVLCIGDRSTATLDTSSVLKACTCVKCLAVWLVGHDLALHHLTDAGSSSRLRPTHMSLTDITKHCWHGGLDVLPNSLTHLNLDCLSNQDMKDIPWQESLFRESSDDNELFSIVSPVMSQLPLTVETFTMVIARDPDSHETARMLEKLATISEASDRFVVVSHDISPHREIRGLHVFEKKHTFDSEWGVGEKCVASRKIKQHNNAIQELAELFFEHARSVLGLILVVVNMRVFLYDISASSLQIYFLGVGDSDKFRGGFCL